MADEPNPDDLPTAGEVVDDADTVEEGDLLGSLLEAASSLSRQMDEARQRLEATEVTGTAGGGAVRIVLSGSGEARSVHIDPGVLDDPGLLEDLVLAALRDAQRAVARQQAEVMGGVDLGGLGPLAGPSGR